MKKLSRKEKEEAMSLNNIGEAVLKARNAKGWSQSYVSVKVGLSKPSYINIEKGRRLPKYEKMLSLIRLLRVKLPAESFLNF